MKIVITLGIAMGMVAGIGFAVDRDDPAMYHGQLMDASCYNQNQTSNTGKLWVTCAPKDSTTAFAIHTDGRIRMLDAAGNSKVEDALHQNMLKRDPNGDMPVVIDGWRHGNTIQVEGIRARGSDESLH